MNAELYGGPHDGRIVTLPNTPNEAIDGVEQVSYEGLIYHGTTSRNPDRLRLFAKPGTAGSLSLGKGRPK